MNAISNKEKNNFFLILENNKFTCPKNSRVTNNETSINLSGILVQRKKNKKRDYGSLGPIGPKCYFKSETVCSFATLGDISENPEPEDRKQYTFRDKKRRLTLEHVVFSSSEDES